MKKLVYIPIIGIIIGTLLMFYDEMYYGLGIYVVSILAIILIIIFDNLSLGTKNILQSLTLFPILQIISISVPQLFTTIYLRYVLICAIMFIPTYSIIKSQHMSSKDLEIDFKKLYTHLPAIILLGTIMMMFIQYTDIMSKVYDTSIEVVSIGEEFTTIFLIISLLISVLVSDTKYWNKYSSNTLDICSDSMLVVFIMIVINKVITIIY